MNNSGVNHSAADSAGQIRHDRFDGRKPGTSSSENVLRRFMLLLLLLSVGLTIGAGVLSLECDSDWMRDWLKSAVALGVTLVITFGLTACAPHVFDFRAFRLPGIFVLGYAGMILMPLPWVYADFPELARDDFLFVATISFLSALGGILTAHLFVPVSALQVRRWIEAPTRNTRMLRLSAAGLLAVCLLGLVFYILQLGAVPVMNAVQGGNTALELALGREDALKLLPKTLHTVVSYLRTMLFPFATLMLLPVAILSRRWVWRCVFAVSLLGNLLMASITLEKSPVVALMGMLVVTWLMVRGRVISNRAMLLIGLAGLAFPVFVIMASYGYDIEPQRVFGAIFKRIFYAPGEVILAYVDYFPRYSDFLMGRTLPHICKLFPEGPIWIENIISMRYFYTGIESGNANSGYPGYLWADFGWLGVTCGGFVVGVLLQSVQTLIMRLPKSPPAVALQAILVWQTFMLGSMSFGAWLDWAAWEILFALILLFPGARLTLKPAPSPSSASDTKISASGSKFT